MPQYVFNQREGLHFPSCLENSLDSVSVVGEREAEGRAETHPIISQSSCLLLRQSAQEIQTRGFAMLFKAIIQVNGRVASCTVFRIPESEKKIFLLPVENRCVGTTFL